MNEILDAVLGFVQGIDPVLRTALAGVAIMLETSVLIGLVVPGDTIVIVTATGVSTIQGGIVLGIVVVCGALVGESIGFVLGRWLGPWLRRSWIGRRIGEHNWQRSERYLLRRGGVAIFLSRFLPVLHSLVPLTVGMSGYSYRRFLAWTTPACILWASIYITVSAGAAQSYRELSTTAHYAGYLFVAIIAVFLLAAYLVKKLLMRSERRHFEAPEKSQADDVKD